MTSYSSRDALGRALDSSASGRTGSELVRALAEAHLRAAEGASFGRIWQQVAEDYIAILGTEDGLSPDRARQSWRSASGSAFEWLVQAKLNLGLREEGLALATQSYVRSAAPNVVRFLQLPAKRRCTQDNVDVWPDNDLIALCRDAAHTLRAIAVISCKTSLRERVMQALFWSLAIRVGIPVRSVFVTLDSQNELGTCSSPTKARKLLEAYFDGTYIANDAAAFCPAIRPFDELLAHLVRWRDEFAPNALREPLELDGS